MKLAHIASAVVTLALGMTSFGAHAVIVDIDAQSSNGTTIQLGAGTYTLSWVGMAGGGLYDAWQYNTAATGNFRDAFTVSANGGILTFDVATSSPFANFSTASAALSAFQNASSYAIYDGTHYVVDPTSPYGSPVIFTIDSATAFTFTVPDYQLADNKGGVSLSITAAVPEPETYALMLGGLAALAFVAKRRSKSDVA